MNASEMRVRMRAHATVRCVTCISPLHLRNGRQIIRINAASVTKLDNICCELTNCLGETRRCHAIIVGATMVTDCRTQLMDYMTMSTGCWKQNERNANSNQHWYCSCNDTSCIYDFASMIQETNIPSMMIPSYSLCTAGVGIGGVEGYKTIACSVRYGCITRKTPLYTYMTCGSRDLDYRKTDFVGPTMDGLPNVVALNRIATCSHRHPLWRHRRNQGIYLLFYYFSYCRLRHLLCSIYIVMESARAINEATTCFVDGNSVSNE